MRTNHLRTLQESKQCNINPISYTVTLDDYKSMATNVNWDVTKRFAIWLHGTFHYNLGLQMNWLCLTLPNYEKLTKIKLQWSFRISADKYMANSRVSNLSNAMIEKVQVEGWLRRRKEVHIETLHKAEAHDETDRCWNGVLCHPLLSIL